MNYPQAHLPTMHKQSGVKGSLPCAGAREPKVNILNALLFSLGALINTLSYLSLASVIIAGIFYFTTYALLALTPLGGAAERRMFSRVFSVGFLMAGVAAVYANQFEDAGQLFSDAAGFYEMAVGKASGLTLIEIGITHEGAMAIVMWRAVYDFFAAMGFEKARYIGILVNVTAVSLAGVVGTKMIRQIFGDDEYRFRRLVFLVSACGLFWLFAGIHLRDSIILLAVSSLAYVWVYFLGKPDLGWRLAQVIAWSLSAFLFLGFFRSEFVFVPVAMGLAAVSALYLGRVERRRRLVVFAVMLVGAIATALMYINFAAEIQLVLDRGQTAYGEYADEQHGSDSLGMELIVRQPTPIRLALGSIYLFVFPVPFWSGFQLESAYNLFKSANAVFFYLVLPLLVIAVLQICRVKTLRSPVLLFVLILNAGFTLAIAGTSLETRHFGAFLMPMFVMASLPDLRKAGVMSVYKSCLLIVLCAVVIVHITWAILKLV